MTVSPSIHHSVKGRIPNLEILDFEQILRRKRFAAECITWFRQTTQQIMFDIDCGTLSSSNSDTVRSASEIIGLVIVDRVVIFKNAVLFRSGFESIHKTVIGASVVMAVSIDPTVQKGTEYLNQSERMHILFGSSIVIRNTECRLYTKWTTKHGQIGPE